jgi:hypothetical protein
MISTQQIPQDLIDWWRTCYWEAQVIAIAQAERNAKEQDSE